MLQGDKLLGGPAGWNQSREKKELRHRVRRHPLFALFGVDKLTIAALAATLARILRGADEIPALLA